VSLRKDIATLSTVLSTADREAHALGDPMSGAEHVVLAALQLDDDSARTALGVTADEFRAAITAVHASALEQLGIDPTAALSSPIPEPTGLHRSTASAQEVIQRTRLIHKAHKPSALKAVYFVQAAAELEQGTAARVFESLGIDRAALAAA
jgi:ATP-dependent Clp protease ATP-binding subunit ClpA